QADLVAARRDLTEARALYTKVGNPVWETIARLAGLRVAAGEAGRTALGPLLADVGEVARLLAELGAPEHAAAACLLQGEIELRLGQTEAARRSIQAALELGGQSNADVVLYQAHLAEALLLEPGAPDEARAA